MAVSIVSVQARSPFPREPRSRIQVTLFEEKADGFKLRKRVECGECGKVFSSRDGGIRHLEEHDVWLCNECREAGEECEWCGEKYPGAFMTNYICKEDGETVDLTVGQLSGHGCGSYWVCEPCHEYMESCSECGRVGHQDDWHYGDFKVLDHEVFCAGCYIDQAIRRPENWRTGLIDSLEEIRDIPFGDFEGRCIDGNPEYMVYTTQWFPSMPDPPVAEANLEELNHLLGPLAELGIEWFMFGDQSTHNVCSVGTNVVVRTEDMAKAFGHMMKNPTELFEPKARYSDGRVNPAFMARHAAELSAMVASGDIGGIQALLDCGGG
jgi:uncharacterized C2H2 Zn-finger protein